MHVAIEYLAVGVLLVLTILAAAQLVETPVRTVETVRAEQLLTVAERIMDKILLTPGYPENWGANLDPDQDITDFGLAHPNATTPYVIDPDKVMRLANLTLDQNPVPVSVERIAELLGIKGEYGFRLEMKPMIRTIIDTVDGDKTIPTMFNVYVKNWQGIGLPNAKVTGIYTIAAVYVGPGRDRNDEGDIYGFTEKCITSSLGVCNLDFSEHIGKFTQNAKLRGGLSLVPFLILHIDWEGFVSISGFSPRPKEEPVYGYVIGNYIFIEGLEDVRSVFNVDDEIVQVIPQYAFFLEEADVIWCRCQPNDPMWCHEVAGRILPARRKEGTSCLIGKVNTLERLSSHIIVTGAWMKGAPAREKGVAIVISRLPEVDITFGPRNTQPANSVTLTRIVQIYNYPYVVRLTLWRWVDGWP